MRQQRQPQFYEYYSPQRSTAVSSRASLLRRSQRRRRRRVVMVVFVLLVVGIGLGIALANKSGDQQTPTQTAVAASNGATSNKASTVALPTNNLAKTLPAALATVMNSHLGSVDVAVYDSKTKQTIHYSNASGTYSTASIMKVSLLEATLLADQAKGIGITDAQLALATPMIEESDNDSATALWQQMGQDETMAPFFSRIGATSTTLNDEGHWGLTQTTALDQLKVLKQFAYPSSSTVLTTASIDTITDLLGEVETSQKWGISGGVPSASTVQVKNGWLQETDGWDVNSIGHVFDNSVDYTVAILTSGSTTESTGIATIKALSTVIYGALAKV